MTSAIAPHANATKFQNLLRELFQFDCADLDFGIYRIMNQKRDVVEKFITDTLQTAVAAELDSGLLAQQAQAQALLTETTQRVIAALGDDAIGDDGELAALFRESPIGKDYRDAQARVVGNSRADVEKDIYNHLYAFFSRYYEDGDFISQQRSSRNQRYAIPYNGEEVYLHWANRDQYYVKTDEYFHNYDWQAPNGVRVHFRLKNADVEQNNVKGDKRFFLPVTAEVQWDANTRAITIPVEYRPLRDEETKRYSTRNQQKNINETAVTAILEQIGNSPDALAALTSERHSNANGPVEHLQYHLRRYTTRNNSDFFIHKDLSGFLNRELDFYLKNEVLHLDHIVNAGQDMAESWFQQMRLIKAVGSWIIDFLAQIEDFQKLLWEKRKFVTETQYCITLGNIGTNFHSNIIANDAQWNEWHYLFDIDGSDRSSEFLLTHPTLVLDTRHFCADFTNRLLASFDDLDELTDGLLVHSENWQALRLLQEKYAGMIQCVYIDPPYNTGNGDFMYKDRLQHSSWMSMMEDRAKLAHALINSKGSFYCQIDHLETHRLRELFDKLFTFQREIIWDIQVLSGFKTIAPNWIRGHETLLFYTASDKYMFNKLRQPHSEKYERMFNRTDENGRKFMIAHGTKRYWDEVKDKGKPIGDVWSDVMSFQQQPTAAERIGFDTQKPEKLLERIIMSSTSCGDTVLDYFGGSGTTAACAQKIGRKYILCEMGEHFFSVVLPRMKRTLFGENTSVSRDSEYRGGGMFKYIRLESYEDALDSIKFDRPGQLPGLESSDEYLLKYQLRWETKDSETLLNVAQLTDPFCYRLRVHINGERWERKVDLPETFNYLLGLNVRTRRVCEDDGRHYLVYRGATRANPRQTVAIIWRTTAGWTEDDFARDRDFIATESLTGDADTVYVNGDSCIPGAKPVEPMFKARMFAGIGS